MSMPNEDWRSPTSRQNIVAKIDEAIQRSGMTTAKKGVEMENHVFQKAKTREEYLGFVARLILHVRELNTKKTGLMNNNGGPNMQDPINALQNLARQGTGNQMMAGSLPNQMPQQANPNMMQGMNPRPVIQQKLQPNVQTGVGGVMMTGLGGTMGGPQVGAGSPLSAGVSLQGMPGRRPDVPMGVPPGGFVGPRGVPAGQYLRQSPTPPITSPVQQSVGMQPGSQMVPSPALVPSPNNPQLVTGGTMQATMQRPMGMASSPSSSCLNTPGQPNASPCSLQEDVAYREKVRQLSKYIEPIRRMIQRNGTDNSNMDKVVKMKTLLDILSNPSKRMPIETLLKCEVVLEKIDFKRAGEPVREQHPLLEALKTHLQSPFINHSLQRTFGPCIEALFGSDIKNVPPPLKRKRVEEPVDDIPEVLQGEIARLDQRFKVSLDPTGGSGGSVQLICWLDDKHLPCVPPMSLSVPEDYPSSPPECHLAEHEHSATPFLAAVKSNLASRVSKLASKFTVSQLLDAWETSVRQACAPTTPSPVPSTATALLVNT